MAYVVDHCWSCCSPLHHRPDCRENVPQHVQEATRRELKRYHAALAPYSNPYPLEKIPNGFPLKKLSAMVDSAVTYYTEQDEVLENLGRPSIVTDEALEFYKRHRFINYAIHQRRQTDEKMVPGIRNLQPERFSSIDEWRLARIKGEELDVKRAQVWEKTCRLLVWAKCAIILTSKSEEYVLELEVWLRQCRPHLMGRPTNSILDFFQSLGEKQETLGQLQTHVTELGRICKPADKAMITVRVAALKVDFDYVKDSLSALKEELGIAGQHTEKQALEAELRKTREEKLAFENMVLCSICGDKQKEWMLRCGHAFCLQCITHLEDHANDPPEMVQEGVGIEGAPLLFWTNATPALCPLCKGPLRPRRRVFFE